MTEATVTVSVSGGPQLAAELDRVAKQVAERQAAILADAGRKVADEWAARVPIGEAPHDPHPGAYRRAMESPEAVYVDTSDPQLPAAYVRPADLGDLPNNQQPRAYAGRLEYGGANRSPEPAARPAVDSARPVVVQTISTGLHEAVTK